MCVYLHHSDSHYAAYKPPPYIFNRPELVLSTHLSCSSLIRWVSSSEACTSSALDLLEALLSTLSPGCSLPRCFPNLSKREVRAHLLCNSQTAQSRTSPPSSGEIQVKLLRKEIKVSKLSDSSGSVCTRGRRRRTQSPPFAVELFGLLHVNTIKKKKKK